MTQIESDILKPVIRSGDIGRYWAKPTAAVLFPYEIRNGKFYLITEERFKGEYPLAWQYLLLNKKLLSGREHDKFKSSGWYQLYPKNLDLWEQPKIMLPYMITRLSAYYDESGYYFVNVTTGGFGIRVNPAYCTNHYITGILNSKLLDWYMRQVSTTFHGGYFAANKQFLIQTPRCYQIFRVSRGSKDHKPSRTNAQSTSTACHHSHPHRENPPPAPNRLHRRPDRCCRL